MSERSASVATIIVVSMALAAVSRFLRNRRDVCTGFRPQTLALALPQRSSPDWPSAFWPRLLLGTGVALLALDILSRGRVREARAGSSIRQKPGR